MFFSSSEAEEKLFEKMQHSKFTRKQRKEAVAFIWNWFERTNHIILVALHHPCFRYSYRKQRVSTMDMLRGRDRWVQFQMVTRRLVHSAQSPASASRVTRRRNPRPRCTRRTTFFKKLSK